MNRKILFGSALSVLAVVSVTVFYPEQVTVFYPEQATVNIQCNYDSVSNPNTLVRSPDGDIGCVHINTAVHKACDGWSILNKTHTSHMDYGPCHPPDFDPLEKCKKLVKNGAHLDYESCYLDEGAELDLELSILPTVGQNATATVTIRPLGSTVINNATITLDFYGNLDVSWSDPRIDPESDWSAVRQRGLNLEATIPSMDPGSIYTLNATITPIEEGKVAMSVRGYGNNEYLSYGKHIFISIGKNESHYQLDDKSYSKDPDINYVWIQKPISQCWTSPWTASHQTVQDYFADLDITVLEVDTPNDRRSMGLEHYSVVCAGCSCPGGSLLFLIQESDYDKMPDIYRSS